jgi:lipoprotein-releasing system permease protein
VNLPFFVAKKYFISRKKKNFINIISMISMSAVAMGTMALVIVLSVFNGLEDLIRSLHNYFDPELKITATVGKSFLVTDSLVQIIENTPGVQVATEVVEDNAYVKYKNSEMVIKLKGVDENFLEHHRIDERIVQGEFKLKEDGVNYALIGRGVQYALSIPKMTNMYMLQLYYPRRGRVSGIDPSKLTNQRVILPSGVFAIEKQYDLNYVFVPLDFAIDLFQYGDRRTSFEIKVDERYPIKQVQRTLKERLGKDFSVLNSDEQHASLLQAIKFEKFFVYITFSFILAVASINIFFSLTMLAIDKKKDISILYALGAGKKLIRSIFLTEGAIIAFSGAIIGLTLGLLICVLQQQFGIVSMGMETAVLEAYPVKMQFPDFLYTTISIVTITILASYRPAVIATRVDLKTNIA